MWKFLLLALFNPASVLAQKSFKSYPVETSFFKSVHTNGIDSIYKSQKLIDISLRCQFNDSCILLINDSIFLNKSIKTDLSLGQTLGITLSQLEYTGSIKIEMLLIKSEARLTEFIFCNSEFPFLEIWFLKDKWLLNYANYIPTLE